MSQELEQWLLEEREEGEDRVATLFKRMKADGRLQDFSDALDDETLREKLYKEYGIEWPEGPVQNARGFFILSKNTFIVLFIVLLYDTFVA